MLQEHGTDELKRWGLVRVSENFRVIALGLPVPKYRGVPLDPPLRSRFQARDITSATYQVNRLALSLPTLLEKGILSKCDKIHTNLKIKRMVQVLN